MEDGREGREEGRKGGKGGLQREKKKACSYNNNIDIIIIALQRTKLVWQLVEHYGNGGADAQSEALGDGGSQGQTISKVVDAISYDDEPG